MPSSYVIGEHFEQFVKTQIGSGRYGSASEVIRDALRLMEEREQLRQVKLGNLKADIQSGLASGPGRPAEEVFAALRKRIKRSAPVTSAE